MAFDERVPGLEQAPPPFDSVDALLRELACEPEPTPPSEAPEPSLPQGTLIGRFELLREIGRGGFGIVYEARDTTLGRSVAFKLVRGGKRLDLRHERLMREAEAAARLSHPNVVTLHDMGTSEYGPYLVLELLDGRTLADRMHGGPIPSAEALAIAIEVAKGLAHAHAAGVVHGDITPGNIFLCDDGRVKVLDLGLARMFGSPDSGGGTRGYVAPEVRSGAPASERADVYALGVVLYQMITGHAPYRADDDRSRPRLRLADAPALADAVESMLKADPGERPRDAEAALSELAAASQPTNRTAVSSKRTRAVLVLASLFAVLVGGGAILRGRGGAGGSSRAAPAIAVLPFVDRSPDSEQAYLGEGFADQVRATLGRVAALRVSGRYSSRAAAKKATPKEAARDLGVTHTMSGLTRRVGDGLEVEAELRDAEGAVVWTRRYARPMADVLSIEDELADGIVGSLAVARAAPKHGGAGGTRRIAPDAYTAYLKARQLCYRGTPEAWAAARAELERALEIAPDFAPAWATLSGVLAAMLDAVGTAKDAETSALRRRVIETAEKAVALDPDLADGLAARGFARGLYAHEWLAAVSDFNRALVAEPNDVDVMRKYSVLAAALGRFEDAVASAEKATERDPLDGRSWSELSYLAAAKGDLARAEEASRRSLAVAPEGSGWLTLGYAQLLAGKAPEALASFARAPGLYRHWGTAMSEHTLGHADRSLTALAELTGRHPHEAALLAATVHVWRGEREQAFRWIDRALANGEDMSAIRYDPVLVRLNDDPRYAAAVKRAHLPLD